MDITEIQIVPIKPNNGLVAIASVVVGNALYLGSIGIHTRLDGNGYRITYPTKSVSGKSFNVFHPIKRDMAVALERAIVARAEEVLPYQHQKSNDHVRHSNNQNTEGFYSIQKPYMFQPNADILNGPGNYLVKCMNNPTSTDKAECIYKPRLTLMKRMTRKGIEIPLKIEFSVAKMLYGNNVDEVEESDFNAIVKALGKAMYDMGVFVSSTDIKNAAVSAFHPSKNIELKDGYTSSLVIKELKKINVSMKMDINKDSYRMATRFSSILTRTRLWSMTNDTTSSDR